MPWLLAVVIHTAGFVLHISEPGSVHVTVVFFMARSAKIANNHADVVAAKADTTQTADAAHKEECDIAKVVFVNDLEMAKRVCKILLQLSVVGLDMEGFALGRNGTTSLLQLSASADEVYIFDVWTLGQELFSAAFLLPILTSPNIIKLCYDCRCDAEALFYQHGVLAFGLYDLQIVYTALFQSADDPYLKGLHKALQAPGVLEPNEIASMVRRKLAAKREWAVNNFDSVFARPLPSEFLQYCAADVAYLFRMHRLWAARVSHESVVEITRQRMRQFIRLTPPQKQAQKKLMSRLDFGKSLAWPASPRCCCG
jgi:hypothetical protein